MSTTAMPNEILQLGMAFWGSKTLLSAVELGVFGELAKAPASVETLTQRLGLHPRGARDFLDALVALKMLERVDGLYCNTSATDPLSRPAEAQLRRRRLGDGQRATLWVLGLADGGAEDGRAAE